MDGVVREDNILGDFEDVFGAGADAVDIIDRFSRQEMRAQRQSKTNCPLFFETYEKAVAWEQENKGVPFIRRRKGDGYEVELVTP